MKVECVVYIAVSETGRYGASSEDESLAREELWDRMDGYVRDSDEWSVGEIVGRAKIYRHTIELEAPERPTVVDIPGGEGETEEERGV